MLADDSLVINEIAPRPHNSGHYTIDACVTTNTSSKCAPCAACCPAALDLLSPVVMVNLLGDVWQADGGEPNWNVLTAPNAHLHLYGKKHARPAADGPLHRAGHRRGRRAGTGARLEGKPCKGPLSVC